MNLLLRPLILPILLAGWPAYAGGSGGGLDGLLTLVVGIPVLALVCVLQLVVVFLKPSRAIKVFSAIVFFASLAFGLYVASDAATLMRSMRTENFAIGCIYFGLLGLSCLLYYRVIRKRSDAL